MVRVKGTPYKRNSRGQILNANPVSPTRSDSPIAGPSSLVSSNSVPGITNKSKPHKKQKGNPNIKKKKVINCNT